MAPPKPPFPTHQTTSTTAPKCHHHGRHTQHQPQQLEELPTPATKGRACGSALPPVRKTSAAHSASLDHLPATPGPDSSFGLVADGGRSTGKLMESSSRRNQSPPPAEIAVADIQLQTAGTGNSSDLGPIGRWGHIEGVEGLAGLLPESVDLARSGNAGQLNFAGIMPEGALRVFDIMPQRSQDIYGGPTGTNLYGGSARTNSTSAATSSLTVTTADYVAACVEDGLAVTKVVQGIREGSCASMDEDPSEVYPVEVYMLANDQGKVNWCSNCFGSTTDGIDCGDWCF